MLPREQWKRNVYAVLLAVFVSFNGFTVVMPFLPLYVRQLGVTDPGAIAAWSGLLFGIAPLLAGLLAPVWGGLADRYGRKPMFVRALATFLLLMLLSAFARNVWHLLAIRVTWGLLGGFGPMALAMVSTAAPEEEATNAIGKLQAVQALPMATGPLMGGALASAIGIRNTFFAGAILYAFALAAVVFLYQEPSGRQAGAQRRQRMPLREVLLQPALLPLALILALTQYLNSGLGPVLPLYVETLDMPRAAVAFWAGLLASCGAVATAASAWGAGRLGARFPLKPLLLCSLLGGIAVSVLLASVQNVPQLLAGRIALGLLAGGLATVTFSLGSRLMPSETRGAAFGFLSTGAMLGVGLSPFLSGAIAAVNIRLVFVAGAALYAASILVALRLPAGDEPSEAPQPRSAAVRSSTAR